MKSVKNYSKKKSRVQQKVKSKVKSRVQPKVQPRIQARSNKKQINKRVNKNIIRGTKKVQRNKNKKVTKKNAQSGGLFGRNRPLKTIFFDVDGTLGDTGCGKQTKPVPGEMYEELLYLLKVLKKKGVKLFILTRCEAGGNICSKDQKEYYEPIVETMDGVFAADVLGIDTNTPLSRRDGTKVWAAIKTIVMEEYCEHKGIPEEQRESVVLIDDDYRNARVANKHGFRAFHNNKTEKVSGAALGMTNNALKKILKEMGVRSKFGFKMKMKYDTSYFFDGKEIPPPQHLQEERNKRLGTELKNNIIDLTRELKDDIKEKIARAIINEEKKNKKVKNVCFTVVLFDGTKLNDIDESSLFTASITASNALRKFRGKFRGKFLEPANDTDIGVFVLYYGNNSKINLKYLTVKTGELSVIKYPIFEEIVDANIQNTLNNPSFQEDLVKIISKLEQKLKIKFRFLPNGHSILDDDNKFVGFGELEEEEGNPLEFEPKVTVSYFDGTGIDLTVPFKQTDIFNGKGMDDDKRKKLKEYFASRINKNPNLFFLYYGTNKKINIVVKNYIEEGKGAVFTKLFFLEGEYESLDDAYNAMNQAMEEDRELLLKALQKYSTQVKKSLNLIFDPNSPEEFARFGTPETPGNNPEFEGFGFQPTVPPGNNDNNGFEGFRDTELTVTPVATEPTVPTEFGFGELDKLTTEAEV